MRGVCLDGEKLVQMGFQSRADPQNHAIGWLQRGYSPLALGLWYDFHEFGLHLGNVGLSELSEDRPASWYWKIQREIATPLAFTSSGTSQVGPNTLVKRMMYIRGGRITKGS